MEFEIKFLFVVNHTIMEVILVWGWGKGVGETERGRGAAVRTRVLSKVHIPCAHTMVAI